MKVRVVCKRERVDTTYDNPQDLWQWFREHGTKRDGPVAVHTTQCALENGTELW